MIKLPARQVRFLKRNEALIVVVGALLLFLTFVVNNIVREELRSASEKISEAETAFIIRDSNFDLYREIDVVDAHVIQGNNEILNRMPKHHITTNLLHKTGNYLDPEALSSRPSVETLRLAHQTRSEFDNLGLLLRNVPQGSHASELNALFKELGTVEKEMLAPVEPIGDEKNKRFDPSVYPRKSGASTFSS